eukprot:TRINITY_DN1394_c0_g1_i9.p2 TRINITY_DN1394_c0_g1~~TRINITY_DN1394_c0_g1_i9.p2  ORF type:complete len:150 (-),score=50.61 TRINITY_DN1394_c0_g1_i9:904-1353(-)
MELVDAGTLCTLLDSRTLTEDDSVCIMRQVLEGIHYVHSKGMIHRDLKPQNILVTSLEQLEGAVKIADFGLGVQDTSSFVGHCGTLLYMAPEQLAGERCHKEVDIWAAGVVMYILMIGKHPFYKKEDDTEEYARKTRTEQLRFPESFPT